MKSPFAALVILYGALLLLTLPHCLVCALECTKEELSGANNDGINETMFRQNCAGMLAGTSLTGVDIHSLDQLDPCGDDKCVAFLKLLAVTAPSCEHDGTNLSQLFDALYMFCSSKPTKMPTNKPSSANTTTKPRSVAGTTPPPPLEVVPVDSGNTTASESESESDNEAQATTRPPPVATTATPPALIKSAAPTPQTVSAVACVVAFLAMRLV